MSIKCIAVDDEPLALRVIESHIERINDVDLIAKCSNAMEAFEVLHKQDVDLLFLDIQMPELTGIDFLKNLSDPPKVIFTTAYRNYAIEAFDLDVLDYLLKPISFERFFKSINKFYKRSDEQRAENHAVFDGDVQMLDHIFIKKGRTKIKLPIDEIVFIESLKDYVKVHTESDEHLIKHQIGRFEQELPETSFIRIHKSFIVSISKICSISPQAIGVGKEKLPLGRNYKELVLKKLHYYSK